jgi:phosphate transport system protein
MMKIDEQVRLCEDLVVSMAKQVRQMMHQAMEALFENQKDKALFVIEHDAYINNFELEINEQAMQVLSLLQPVASDLRRVVVTIKIANDLERIGDYAKNIARYVIKNQTFPEAFKPDAQEILKAFFSMFDKMLEVVSESNVKKAYEVADLDETMDALFKQLISKVDASYNDKIPLTFATVALLRNIERSGDHTKNICEHVIYRAKAQYVDFG